LHNNGNDDGGNGMNDCVSALFAIPACLLDNNNGNGSGGGAGDGASALLAVPY
jgi:hypothetical protein